MPLLLVTSRVNFQDRVKKIGLYRAEDWVVVCNPKAGGYSAVRRETILRGLRAEGIRTRVLETEYAGHLKELVQSASGTRVAVLGGDGSFNEAVNGMLGSSRPSRPLVCLPAGTANVLARELNIPLEARKVAATVVRMSTKKVYPAMLNGRAFLLMAGLGYDARLVHASENRNKIWLGRSYYFWQGFLQLLKTQTTFTWQTIEKAAKSSQQNVVWLLACRAKRYGGDFILSPQAGLLKPQLSFVTASTRREIFFLLRTMVRSANLKFVKYRLGSHCIINSATPLFAHVDGEPVSPQNQFEITISPKPICLTMP